MNDNLMSTAAESETGMARSNDPYSLPSRYYTDPDITALETERIFYRCWNFAGHVSQLRNPGGFLTCRVGEESIIVMRVQVTPAKRDKGSDPKAPGEALTAPSLDQVV